ncbi:MAG: nitroreductase family protein [Nitrospinae bacterium]|nr:nitroreductase family protein [Nitrospinota bacterium]MBI3815346.1 nitroreductase family protein [Nitrospinota bacterium]
MHPVIEIIKSRRSVREYRDKEVEGELLHLILEAGCNAPSAHNAQPWYFGIVKGEKKEKISGAIREYYKKMVFGLNSVLEQSARIIDSAPVIITVWNHCPLSSRIEKIKDIPPEYKGIIRDYEIQSISAAIENMWIAATALGLGMAWLGITVFCEKEIKELLNIRGNLITILSVGYPKGELSRTKRISLERIAIFYQ